MKTIFKKPICKIMALVMILTTLTAYAPAAVQAETTQDGYVYSVNEDGTVCITKYEGTATDIVIPTTIDGKDVTSIADKAFQATAIVSLRIHGKIATVPEAICCICDSLTDVVLEEGVTCIEASAFEVCRNLKNITIPNSVTTIEDNAFVAGMPDYIYTDKDSYAGKWALEETEGYLGIGYKYNYDETLKAYVLTDPNGQPISSPTQSPTQEPTTEPTHSPTTEPTKTPAPTQTATPATKEQTSEKEKVKIPSVSKVKSVKAKGKKKSVILTWKKMSGIKGYEIEVSTKKNFKQATKIKVKKSAKKYTIKKLKKKKTYYIRIRAYKTYKGADGKTKKSYGKYVKVKTKTK